MIDLHDAEAPAVSGEITDQFSAYHDGELGAGERAAFEAYLARHPEAEAEYDGFARSIELTRGLRMVFAPDDMTQKITRRLNQQSRGALFNDRLGKARTPYELFIVVLLVIGGALYMLGLATRDAPLNVIDATLASGSTEVHVTLEEGQDMHALIMHLRARGWRVEPISARAIEVFTHVDELPRLNQAVSIATGVHLPPHERRHERVIVRLGSRR